ncbi:MAG: amylo-alpha,6-glucosidase [Actinomycetia bacterium]|nr:amylo-alpha,6-glucosidase [Actinomycetes bacterium]
MREPFDALAESVATIGRRQLVLVDGRTFAISDEAGAMWAPTHGMVHDDLRHLSRFRLWLDEASLEILASSAPTPLSAVTVARFGAASGSAVHGVVTRRRWVASGLREDIEVQNTAAKPARLTLRVELGADFAHIFDVKAGLSAPLGPMTGGGPGDVWTITDPERGIEASSRIESTPPPDAVDVDAGTFTWHLSVPAHGEVVVCLTVEPVVNGDPAGLAFGCGVFPDDTVPVQRQARWLADVPSIVSTDPRLSVVVDQALADIAALRILDPEHPDRVVIAAGAPWFMTVFGRDSLLTSWMALPFDETLAVGVLHTLAELQGKVDDPASEEQPGKILHELRRHGGAGPFATRDRYYGTVDATPLFLMLAAEAWRWGALGPRDLERLAPAVDAALGWVFHSGDTDGDGFVDYRRRHASGLSNQGWKDSWDGVNFADGSLPQAPVALVEVQGYTYAALRGVADLVAPMALDLDADDLRDRAERLKVRFNERFWDPRGWYAMGLDGEGRRIDSLSTNPGHALWTGIADETLADQYLDHLLDTEMWTGWGLRTLAASMAAYDPLSYHNGSVWPHDTALCAAGAARYGRWDVVDAIVDGAFDAAIQFNGRPPELFSGISRAAAPMPVAYPASCSPQAWSSASILLLIRTMLDLAPSQDRTELRIGRSDLTQVPDLALERIAFAQHQLTVTVEDGVGKVFDS